MQGRSLPMKARSDGQWPGGLCHTGDVHAVWDQYTPSAGSGNPRALWGGKRAVRRDTENGKLAGTVSTGVFCRPLCGAGCSGWRFFVEASKKEEIAWQEQWIWSEWDTEKSFSWNHSELSKRNKDVLSKSRINLYSYSLILWSGRRQYDMPRRISLFLLSQIRVSEDNTKLKMNKYPYFHSWNIYCYLKIP